jgi:cystathionine gamma-synthase
MSADARAQAGISDGLLRLSVGIEALADLKADLTAAIARAAAISNPRIPEQAGA